MPRTPIVSLFSLAIALSAAGAVMNGQPAEAQSSPKTAPAASSAPSGAGWVAPGTKGSAIDGTAFHAQVLLDMAGFSSGVIDGKMGSNLARAVKGFQKARGLTVNGKLDNATRQALLADGRPSTIMVKLDPDQVAGPFVLPFPHDPEAQAELPAMSYRNMLEKVAEEYHTTPETVVALNGPKALIGPGQTLRLPNVTPKAATYDDHGKGEIDPWFKLLNIDTSLPKGDHIVVDKSEGQLMAMDAQDKLIAQFPVTTGSSHDPLPLGNWKVTTYSYLPPFNYQPDLFWDVSDDKAEQKLPPGPNGPVGVAWLDLTKEHYGIHGTPEPQTIGKTQSHGCLRMTNWDVLRLSQMMKPGFRAVFQA